MWVGGGREVRGYHQTVSHLHIRLASCRCAVASSCRRKPDLLLIKNVPSHRSGKRLPLLEMQLMEDVQKEREYYFLLTDLAAISRDAAFFMESVVINYFHYFL